jgi:hypothetical protein
MGHKVIPVLLSFIFSGLGQIYKREYLKGGSLILLQTSFVLLIINGEHILFEIGIFGFPVIWVAGMLEAADLLSYEYLLFAERRERWMVIGGSLLAMVLGVGLFAGTMWRFRPLSSSDLRSERIAALVQGVTGNALKVEKQKYIISLGVFKNEGNARHYSFQLLQSGYPVKLKRMGDKWMVFMEGFSGLEEAKTKAVDLFQNDLECYVAKIETPRVPIFIPKRDR